jgi:phospholysine phosphohistidine inorganic pyrophosphate phosphatase
MTALLIDLDGVIYQGRHPVSGAVEALDWLQNNHIRHLFLTNTTSRPRSALVEKLKQMGIHTEPHRILTPPVAACRWLQEKQPGAIALFVRPETFEDFENITVLDRTAESGAGAVVLGDLGTSWTFSDLNRAFRLLTQMADPLLIALGMTRYWRSDSGLQLDVGPFIKALEFAVDCEAVVLGKPSEAFYHTACDLMESPPESTLMIGDDIIGDILGAQRSGLRGIQVRTGKFRAEDLKKDIHPDFIVNSIADLPDLLQRIT